MASESETSLDRTYAAFAKRHSRPNPFGTDGEQRLTEILRERGLFKMADTPDTRVEDRT